MSKTHQIPPAQATNSPNPFAAPPQPPVPSNNAWILWPQAHTPAPAPVVTAQEEAIKKAEAEIARIWGNKTQQPANIAPKTCATRLYVKTEQEANEGPLAQLRTFGGKHYNQFRPLRSLASVDNSSYIEFYDPMSGDWITVKQSWVKQMGMHTFKDYGMKRSWCDHCGVAGHFDPNSGTYKE